jgi:hypothetical protein
LLLMTIPGIDVLSARIILSEIGRDMSRFPTAAVLSKKEVSAIRKIMAWRKKRFENSLTTTVTELPDEVRAKTATPRLVRGILEFMSEDGLTFEQIRQMDALNIGSWKIRLKDW